MVWVWCVVCLLLGRAGGDQVQSPDGCWEREKTWCLYFIYLFFIYFLFIIASWLLGAKANMVLLFLCVYAMYMHMHLHMYLCVYDVARGCKGHGATYMYICTCVYVSVYLCVYTCVYVYHTYLYISANDCVHGHMCVCMYKRKSATVIITVFMLPLLVPLSLPPLASG